MRVHTLHEGSELEPSRSELSPLVDEEVCDWEMSENVLKVADNAPVETVLEDSMGGVDEWRSLGRWLRHWESSAEQ